MKEFGRQPGSFTVSVWAKTSSQLDWSSLPGWIRGQGPTNRRACRIWQKIHASKNTSRACRFPPTVRDPLIRAAGAACGTLPQAIAFRLGLGFGKIHGASVRRAKNSGQDFLFHGHLVFRIKEIPARRVEANQAARLLAAKTVLGLASGFQTHLPMVLITKYVKVIPRTRTHVAPLSAPATSGRMPQGLRAICRPTIP